MWGEEHRGKNLEGVCGECELLNLMEWKWRKVGKEIAESLETLTSSRCWLRHRRACLEMIICSAFHSPQIWNTITPWVIRQQFGEINALQRLLWPQMGPVKTQKQLRDGRRDCQGQK